MDLIAFNMIPFSSDNVMLCYLYIQYNI